MEKTIAKIFQTQIPYEYIYDNIEKINDMVPHTIDVSVLSYLNQGKSIAESIDMTASTCCRFQNIIQRTLHRKYKHIIKKYIRDYNTKKRICIKSLDI